MRAECISTANCQYRSDTGYCGYTGNGCVLNDLVHSVRIDEPSYKIIRQLDVSDESIEKIAEAVANKLHQEVVEVVRCKDCRFNDGVAYCEMHYMDVNGNDFCSWAEIDQRRKEKK